jgi:ankyrin repeat protein
MLEPEEILVCVQNSRAIAAAVAADMTRSQDDLIRFKLACLKGDCQQIRDLVNRGVTLKDEKDEKDGTELAWGVFAETTNVVSTLLDLGFDINATNKVRYLKHLSGILPHSLTLTATLCQTVCRYCIAMCVCRSIQNILG